MGSDGVIPEQWEAQQEKLWSSLQPSGIWREVGFLGSVLVGDGDNSRAAGIPLQGQGWSSGKHRPEVWEFRAEFPQEPGNGTIPGLFKARLCLLRFPKFSSCSDAPTPEALENLRSRKRSASRAGTTKDSSRKIFLLIKLDSNRKKGFFSLFNNKSGVFSQWEHQGRAFSQLPEGLL